MLKMMNEHTGLWMNLSLPFKGGTGRDNDVSYLQLFVAVPVILFIQGHGFSYGLCQGGTVDGIFSLV